MVFELGDELIDGGVFGSPEEGMFAPFAGGRVWFTEVFPEDWAIGVEVGTALG